MSCITKENRARALGSNVSKDLTGNGEHHRAAGASGSRLTSYLSPRELHERWGMHPESIRRIIREGRIGALRIGKRLRVSLEHIEQFEAECRINRG